MSLKKPIMFVLSLIIATISIFNSSMIFATPAEDSDITTGITALLISENDIPSNSISVSTKDRVVILKGTVDTALQAHKAIEIASSVNGVIDVVDTQLKLKGSQSLVADSLITAKVKGKIRYLYTSEKIVNGYDLHVETTDQVVHIFGRVAREADLGTIVAAAKEVKGVKSVKTNIKV